MDVGIIAYERPRARAEARDLYLPLYDKPAKVGLGLWNQPAVAFALESILLLGGVALYLRTSAARRTAVSVFAAAMLAVHSVAFFGAPPETPTMAAVMAFGSHLAFAAVAAWLERTPAPPEGAVQA